MDSDYGKRHYMEDDSGNTGGKKSWLTRENMWYILLLAAYLIVGALASHPFDDAIYAQNAQFFYFLRIPPFLSLPMGAYYDVINIGGYFFTILLYMLHIQNVITIQLGVKIPFIIFSFLTGLIVFKIGKSLGFDGRKASLLLLTSPIYFFTALIYGSAIIISVFFLVAALYLMIRGRNVSSAAFYGMAIGSYLYPVFAVPFLLRYFWIKQGRKEALKFLAVSSVFAAIGQIIILFLYVSKGFATSAPSSPQGYLAPYSYITYYSPLDFLNIFNMGHILPGETLPLLYYLSALIASFAYFALPKEKVNMETVITFLFIQGILFSSLAPYNLPSYMAAEIPLAIIVAFIYRRWVFIGLTWLSSFLSFVVMQTINPVGFIIYFSDLNQKILSIKNTYPSWVVSLAGSLYAISILSNLIFLGKRGARGPKVMKTIAAQSSVIVVLVIVSVLVLAPVVHDVPANMYLSPEVDTFQADISSYSIFNGNLVVTYSMPLSIQYGHYQGKYISGVIEYNESRVVMYHNNAVTTSVGNNTYPISILYPLADAEVTMFSPSNGIMDIYLSNINGNIFPSSSSIARGVEYEHIFNFSSTLDGNYSLHVNSTVPYYSSASLPSLILAGSLAVTGMTVGKTPVNGVIPGYLISKEVTVEFRGPFLKVPPAIPVVYFYVSVTGATPFLPYVILGAAIFSSIIIFSYFFSRRLLFSLS